MDSDYHRYDIILSTLPEFSMSGDWNALASYSQFWASVLRKLFSKILQDISPFIMGIKPSIPNSIENPDILIHSTLKPLYKNQKIENLEAEIFCYAQSKQVESIH